MADAVRLTRRELDVMSVLWRRGRATVGEVRDELADDLAYPTVQTMLRVLEGKGYVAHTVDGRAFLFHALVEQDEVDERPAGVVPEAAERSVAEALPGFNMPVAFFGFFGPPGLPQPVLSVRLRAPDGRVTERRLKLRGSRSGARRLRGVEIAPVKDPRIELEEHYYNATHTKLLDLGLEPNLLTDEVVAHLIETIQRYKDRILLEPIAPKTRWDPRA